MSEPIKLASAGVITTGSGVSGYLDVVSVVISGVGVLSGIIFGCFTVYAVIQNVKKDKKISKNEISILEQGDKIIAQGDKITELTALINKMNTVPKQGE